MIAMIRFLDGPAAILPHGLLLRRAPTFLRVVVGPHEWNALDLLTDTPEHNETIYAYQLVGKSGWVHLDYTDRITRRRKGVTYPTGDYRLCDPQPDEATMRDNSLWQAWAIDAMARLLAAAAEGPIPPGTPGVCKSCGAAIRWADTVAGSAIPLDPDPSATGNLAIVNGKASHVGKGLFDERHEGPRYISHFSTCPNAAMHRKKG